MSQISVYLRFRPLDQGQVEFKHTIEGRRVIVNGQVYELTNIFSQDASQEDVFHEVGVPLVIDFLKGQDASLLAYGQSSAGKTHTLLGSKENCGIIFKCFDLLQQELSAQIDRVTTLLLAIYEVYNGRIYDLNDDSQIKELQANKDGYFIENLKQLDIRHKDQLIKYLDLPDLISLFTSNQFQRTTDQCNKQANLIMVDLAGSENYNKAQSQDKQGLRINVDLFSLGQLIEALVKGHPHVPFRQTTLNKIMKGIIGANNKCKIILNCNPAEQCKLGVQAGQIKTNRFVMDAQGLKQTQLQNKCQNCEQLHQRNQDLENEVKLLRDQLNKVEAIQHIVAEQQEGQMEHAQHAIQEEGQQENAIEEEVPVPQQQQPIQYHPQGAWCCIRINNDKTFYLFGDQELQLGRVQGKYSIVYDKRYILAGHIEINLENRLRWRGSIIYQDGQEEMVCGFNGIVLRDHDHFKLICKNGKNARKEVLVVFQRL